MKIQINYILLGDTYPLNMVRIKSKIFTLKEQTAVPGQILSDNPHQIKDDAFRNYFDSKVDKDFTVIIVNRPLEGNFFTRFISENLLVITLFEIEKLYLSDGITLEMYIERYLLAFTTMYLVYKNIAMEADALVQMNSTGCLFDFAMYKPDLVKFFKNPMICKNVQDIILEKRQNAFLEKLQKEIKKLKIGTRYKLSKWIAQRPILSILIAYTGSLIFNRILGNLLSEIIKKFIGL